MKWHVMVWLRGAALTAVGLGVMHLVDFPRDLIPDTVLAQVTMPPDQCPVCAGKVKPGDRVKRFYLGFGHDETEQ